MIVSGGKLKKGFLSDNGEKQDLEFRELIMDNGVKIWKPVAYYFESSSMLSRHTGLLEHGISVSVNLSHLTIVTRPKTVFNTIFIAAQANEEVQVGKSKFLCSNKPVDVLSTKRVLFTTLEEVRIQLACKCGKGYSSLEDSTEYLEDVNLPNNFSYMPIATEFTLFPYVRILPYDGEFTRVRLENGMTEEYLNRILEGGL